MEPVQVYAIAAGGVLVVLLMYCASSFISRWIQDRTLFYVFKYLIYPVLIRRKRFLTPLTRWYVLWIIIYWGVTAVCNLVGVSTIAQAGTRAGSLSVLHLVPLLFTGRLSFAANLLGLSWQSYMTLHSTIGLMAFVQGLIHTLIFVTHNVFRIKDVQQFYGLLVRIPPIVSSLPMLSTVWKGATAFMSIVVLLIIRNYLHEAFQKTHYALAVLVAYAIWRHLNVKPVFSRFYLYIAACIFAATTIARYCRLLLRNVAGGRPYASTKITRIGDAIRIQINVPRPWKIRAGQYVYIWMPGVSLSSVLQSHPFMITWWDHNIHGQGSNIYLLVKPESGFTQNLVQHGGSLALKCWIDGPYGNPVDMEEYGSVLMFASGIGIAAQVPHIKKILKDFRDAKTRTKSILLVWQLDNENDQDWVQDWMTELLNEDKTSYILRIRLYVSRNFDDGKNYGDKERYGEHDSIRKFYGRPKLEDIIKTEIAEKCGRLLITTSADGAMQDKVHETATKFLEKDVRLSHLEFQPRERITFWAPQLPDVKHEGVA